MTRVLLVEDDADFRANMGTWLGRAGYDVVLAEDGAAAVALLGGASFDVVVTDLCMPAMSGLELLGVVAERHPATQVVFLTGQATLDAAIAALREGRAFDFVLKPLRDLSAFRATIERAAARAREKAPVARPTAADPLLPERDREILALVGLGLDNRAIAERLTLSERTVRNRLSALYDRLGVTNRTQAVLWGQERGLI
jgi:DNA-binding NarL/FixJ family response regulator